MFNKIYSICAATIIMTGFVSQVSAEEVCHNVNGSVTTENVTASLQTGSINLMIGADGEVFSKTGSLVGNVTEQEGFFTTWLSHVANFSNGRGNSFSTTGDKAVFAGVRLFDEEGNELLDKDGNYCSLYIHETISNIPHGTGFFNNVTDVEIFADGYISNCPGENNNHFELSGTICVE